MSVTTDTLLPATIADRIRSVAVIVTGRQGAAGIARAGFIGRLSEVAGARIADFRRERDVRRMVEVLDRLNDRQLRALGLDRLYLHGDIEERYASVHCDSLSADGSETAGERLRLTNA